jgi:hypothetical protein
MPAAGRCSVNRPIAYLNTDLDLVSATDLTELAAALGANGMLVLHCELQESGDWQARLETDVQHQAPEENILAILAIVEALPQTLREAWAGCTRRDFSIGFDCGDEPRAAEHGLTSDTLGRIAAAGGRLSITLYAPHA